MTLNHRKQQPYIDSKSSSIQPQPLNPPRSGTLLSLTQIIDNCVNHINSKFGDTKSVCPSAKWCFLYLINCCEEWYRIQGCFCLINCFKGGSVITEPSRQLSDDCTHKRNGKRKVGKPIYD